MPLDEPSNEDARAERSLDPADWEEFRRLGHRAVDDLVDYLRDVADRPVWQPLPADARRLFSLPLPRSGMPLAEVYDDIHKHILPYPTNNIHPRFWSWVGGTGTASQLIADMAISAMNSASLGFDEVASSYVELQLLGWLKSMLGYPDDASGLLVSGGSMANLVGLAVARTASAAYDLRERGVDLRDSPRLVFYASQETHSSVRKAIELLGLGSRSLRLVPVLDDFTIDVDALLQSIADDRRGGHRPACIVANAGTVNTGALDPIDRLADVAAAENLWLHVDGAFGAFARLSPESAHLVAGMERADSLAFDLHKWLYVQYDCGCTLIRPGAPHRETFSVTPSYLSSLDRGLPSGPLNFSEYGVQLSRSFKALRAWVALRNEGVDRYGRQIEQNIRQARYLSGRIEKSDRLELLAPTSLNIVNFRYVDPALDAATLDDLNAEILMRLHERGIAAPSATLIRGRFSLRVAICNHRSTRQDFDALVDGAVAIGEELQRGS
ncbi:MAG: aminotransferase class I/II-fold pyridoxal phosphate-dependent enzyme [Gammaproteobacteria bacterium]|nr:aminotransferase class I/II-fold pyridoxal phosphate-dependent enzyme [Gammaproteobacteria bacterium]